MTAWWCRFEEELNWPLVPPDWLILWEEQGLDALLTSYAREE